VNDDALLARQAGLQRDAEEFVRGLGLVELLGRAGRVVPLGSAATGLMVWRDVDFGVDASGLTAGGAWETLRPLLPRCSSLRYDDDRRDRRHYFVLRIDGWKVDVSLWADGMPAEVEAFQAGLIARLEPETRLVVLRLKDFWRRRPEYPETVGAWQIYDAVLNHDVATLDGLDAYLAARGFPTRPGDRAPGPA
jgi:hypothetical protein